MSAQHNQSFGPRSFVAACASAGGRGNHDGWRRSADATTTSSFYRSRRLIALVKLALALALSTSGTGIVFADVAPGAVWVVELEGPISPAAADYFVRHLEDAEDADAELLVIRLDTPGGLDDSMRRMIKAILASDTPVATFVSPNGARAASAGTYILYASHIAAMAPATNVGSSTPVQLGGPGGLPSLPSPPTQEPTQEPSSEPDADGNQPASRERAQQPDQGATGTAMEKKVINDAVAYILGLARLRGRDELFARNTVLNAENVTAYVALERNIIDLIADDVPDLLTQLDGRTIAVTPIRNVRLATQTAPIHHVIPDWRHEFLSFITNPNVAYILMMVGVYGLILEFYSPGLGIAGVTGMIALLLGFYAMQMLPVSYAGLALILLGIALMVGEAFNPSFGALGIGGAIAFVVGSIMLMDTDAPAYQLSLPLIVGTAATTLGLGMVAIGAALKARSRPVVNSAEAVHGAHAEAVADFEEFGEVRAFGEIWQAVTATPVRRGDALIVTGREGLVLSVQAAPPNAG